MPLKHRYLRGKHCQIDTLLSKAVIEKMYTNDFCGRNFLKYHTFQDFLRPLYNFGSNMHCLSFKFANFQQVNKYFIIKNLLNQRLVFN